MILIDLTKSEDNPIYQELHTDNAIRHYDFLESIVNASAATNSLFLSQAVLKALNYHAIACLHPFAGEYRPARIKVGNKTDFPEPWQVPGLMDGFINDINRNWDEADPYVLAAYVLWRINRIHPFVNGNGRTARAACLFVLCMKTGGWLDLKPILPELIHRDRAEYIEILRRIDATEDDTMLSMAGMANRMAELVEFLKRLLEEQLATAAQAKQN